MQNFYGIASIESIGSVSNLQVRSIGSVLEYISLTQKQNLPIFELPKIINTKSTMHIDASARRNLEIVTNLSGHKRGSLLDVIDHTTTKPGSRLLHKFLSSPLADMRLINSRLEITEFFYKSEGLTEELRKLLRSSGDLEKCLSRVSMNRSSPRDLLTIQTTLEIALEIKGIFLQHFGLQVPVYIEPLVTPLSGDEELSGVIKSAIKEDAPANLMDGEIIKPEYHPKVAELDHLIKDSRSIIDKLKERYKNETGIDGLKISHNNVIGLFIEVTAKNSSKIIDPQFIHRQTTVNAARYTTLELQKLESEMVNAKSLKVSLEKELYQEICELVIKKLPNLKALSNALALIDVFTNFAYIALEYGYTKPLLTEGEDLVIESGRHPVVERSLKIKAESSFVSNNSSLSCEKRVWLITGPNMSGKSTFLRQNALISILAQIGSFVPAKYAKIGVIDKIFSRIGAGDDLLKNQSTFMVEMIETSAILAQATAKSLIILDEIGRGTSTYDGVAIAWSVLEHIHDKIRSRCLFATHYHELTNMADFLPALDNYTVAIDEKDGEILFLHRIIKGAADKSYGIHVAELAGLPGSVISRANELLAKLEKGSEKKNKAIMKNESHNLSLF
jgi:DNA mismatch repair protein MutS